MGACDICFLLLAAWVKRGVVARWRPSGETDLNKGSCAKGAVQGEQMGGPDSTPAPGPTAAVVVIVEGIPAHQGWRGGRGPSAD